MKKSEFEQIVVKAFRALENEHGFKRSEPVYSKKGCMVQFLNKTTDVTLHYDIGSEPWLAVTDAGNPKNKTTLEWILVERGIEKAPVVADAFKPAQGKESELASKLEIKNQQLIQHGADFIKGDFSLMPALQKRAKKYEAEYDRYLARQKIKI